MSSSYWNSMEFDSEGTVSTKNSSSPRKYIDPWDLENYAYMKKHLDYHDMSSTPSAAGEPLDASFYYTPFDKEYEPVDEHPPRYSKYEDVYFKKGKYDSNNYYYQPYSDGDDIYGVTPDYSDMDECSESESPLVTDGSLLYMYETTTRCRKMAVPKTPRKNYDYHNNYGYYNDAYHSANYSVYSPVEDPYNRKKYSSMPIYDDISMNRAKPENFGLSNYGHLKIDYSFSWNSLDRFIGK